MFAVDVTGVFNCCRTALPSMIRRHSGKIINVSSIWGICGASCEVHYSAAKAAVIGLTKALAKEVGPSGIQVNCVAPGVVDTKMNAALTPEDKAELCDETPLGRFGSPDDIAAAMLFFASPAADFITGQVLSPNGGFVI
jgi:3-oxoacyl-[acyl-carrier protein] reductase